MREKQLLNKKGLTHESIPTADMVKMKKKNIMLYAACEGPNNLTPHCYMWGKKHRARWYVQRD